MPAEKPVQRSQQVSALPGIAAIAEGESSPIR
jgi:hypothetical protein